MREADIERIVKAVWRDTRNKDAANGKHMYIDMFEARAVMRAAIDLGIVRLNEDAPKVLPYSQEKVI